LSDFANSSTSADRLGESSRGEGILEVLDNWPSRRRPDHTSRLIRAHGPTYRTTGPHIMLRDRTSHHETAHPPIEGYHTPGRHSQTHPAISSHGVGQTEHTARTGLRSGATAGDSLSTRTQDMTKADLPTPRPPRSIACTPSRPSPSQATDIETTRTAQP